MDISGGVFSLVGTVVGGAIVLVGQWRGDLRIERAEKSSEARHSERENTTAQIRASEELLDAMVSTFGTARRSVMEIVDLGKLDHAESMEPIVRELRWNEDLVLAKGAKVADAEIAASAARILKRLGVYLTQEISRDLGEGIDPAEMEVFDDIQTSLEEFIEAVRQHLEVLRSHLISASRN